MITQKQFEQGTQENIARVTHYESGGDGSDDGGCDCIGLIIGAVRLAGGSWPWTHGSNYAARYRIRGLRSIRNASTLEKDEIVFDIIHISVNGLSGSDAPAHLQRKPGALIGRPQGGCRGGKLADTDDLPRSAVSIKQLLAIDLSLICRRIGTQGKDADNVLAGLVIQ